MINAVVYISATSLHNQLLRSHSGVHIYLAICPSRMAGILPTAIADRIQQR